MTIGSRTFPGVPRTLTSPHAVTLRSERRRSIRARSPPTRRSREVLIFLTEAQADLQEMRPAEWNVSHTIGLQAMMPVVVPRLTLLEPAHAEAMIPKLRGLATAFEDAAARLREGVAGGMVPMRSTAEKSADQVDALLALPAAGHPLGLFAHRLDGWAKPPGVPRSRRR